MRLTGLLDQKVKDWSSVGHRLEHLVVRLAIASGWASGVSSETVLTIGSLLVIAVAGTLVRVAGINRTLNGDEIAVTLAYIRRPIWYTATNWGWGGNQWLAYVLDHIFITVFGETELTLRLPALLFGIAGIFAFFVVGRAVFGKTAGLLAALLLTVAPVHIEASSIAKGYTALILFSLLSYYFFYRARLKPTRRRYWIGFIVSCVLAVYTQPYALFLLAS